MFNFSSYACLQYKSRVVLGSPWLFASYLIHTPLIKVLERPFFPHQLVFPSSVFPSSVTSFEK